MRTALYTFATLLLIEVHVVDFCALKRCAISCIYVRTQPIPSENSSNTNNNRTEFLLNSHSDSFSHAFKWNILFFAILNSTAWPFQWIFCSFSTCCTLDYGFSAPVHWCVCTMQGTWCCGRIFIFNLPCSHSIARSLSRLLYNFSAALFPPCRNSWPCSLFYAHNIYYVCGMYFASFCLHLLCCLLITQHIIPDQSHCDHFRLSMQAETMCTCCMCVCVYDIYACAHAKYVPDFI